MGLDIGDVFMIETMNNIHILLVNSEPHAAYPTRDKALDALRQHEAHLPKLTMTPIYDIIEIPFFDEI
jgi:hypothetical protein